MSPWGYGAVVAAACIAAALLLLAVLFAQQATGLWTALGAVVVGIVGGFVALGTVLAWRDLRLDEELRRMWGGPGE